MASHKHAADTVSPTINWTLRRLYNGGDDDGTGEAFEDLRGSVTVSEKEAAEHRVSGRRTSLKTR
jgi:hypothetical protein